MARKTRRTDESEKSVAISLFVPMPLRQQLDDAAAAHEQSLTKEVATRLEQSFAGDPQLFAVLAKIMRALETKAGNSWRNDPWAAQQLAGAMAELGRELGAKGKPQAPPGLKMPPGITADTYGLWLAQMNLVFGDML